MPTAASRPLVAPSAFYGGRVFPDYLAHLENIRNFVRDGQKYGSEGMLNTSWDDLGEDLFDMGWYGVVFAAACSWQSGESDIARYRDAFDWAFYRVADGHPFAEGIGRLADVHGRVGAVNFEMAYSSPFSEIGAMQQNHLQRVGASREMRLWCEEAYTSFCHARNRVALHGSTVDALLFAARRMDFVFHKAVLADEMSDLYDAVVRDDDRGYAVNTALYDLVMPYASRLGSLRDMTKELKLFHRDLWHAENRPIHWGRRSGPLRPHVAGMGNAVRPDPARFAAAGAYRHAPASGAGGLPIRSAEAVNGRMFGSGQRRRVSLRCPGFGVSRRAEAVRERV